MPVNLVDIEFYDLAFNPAVAVNSYKSNAGDRWKMRLEIESSIRVTSINNSLQLDSSVNQIIWNGGNWIEEGFRSGDSVVCTVYTFGGTVINTWTTTASLVTPTILDLGTIPTWFDVLNGEYIVVQVPSKTGRGDLQVLFNHVSNTNGGSEFSLIDGEVTRGVLLDVNSLALSSSQVANLTGNQSGQYVEQIEITRVSAPTNTRRFWIDITFLNSGIYDQNWFQSSDCLKPLVKLIWTRDTGDLDNAYTETFVSTANTGWYNEGHNIDPIDSNVVQGIQSLDYQQSTTHTVIVYGPTLNIGIGASYVPDDVDYYKNKLLSQTKLGMVAYTQQVSVGTINSASNDLLAQYSIEILSVTTLGLQTTIVLKFTPNSEFFTFMDSRDEGDRLFYLWVKCGNVNHLVFADQLEYVPPVGDPLVMVDDIVYYDHASNLTDFSGTEKYTSFNTEDDVAFVGSFLLEKNKIYNRFSAKIEAYNSATDEDFTLLQVAFDFDGLPISGDGRYLVNETASVVTTLPNTSVKRNAFFVLEPSIDIPDFYGVKIYFPFLLRWEYWLPQTNASTDFWPDQNKNWLPYDNTGSWEVRLECNLEDTLSHLYTKPITINDYDSEVDLTNNVDLILDSTNAVVSAVIEGQLMRVRSRHQITNGLVWDQPETWGMITVEPYESAQRFILSSVVPTDFNPLNPLTPLIGNFCSLTFPSPTVAQLECYFNPDLINLTNGVKFTSKIKGCQKEADVFKTTSPDDSPKTTTLGQNKTLA